MATLSGMRVLTVIGNRPQFIKAAPLSVALREAGIDDRETAVIEQAVHVHVPEPGHPDRELHADHVRSHLGDFFGRGILFLFVRPGRR